MKKQLLFCSLALASSLTAFAEVGDVITNLDQLSNDKCYTILPLENVRGTWVYNPEDPTHLYSTGKLSQAVDTKNANQQFVFVKSSSGQLYVYSVGAKKFLQYSDDGTCLLVDDIRSSDAFATILNSTCENNSEYPWVVALGNNHHVGISNNYTYGVITFYNDTEDKGNCISITEAGDFSESKDLIAKVEQVEDKIKKCSEANAYLKVPANSVGGYAADLWNALNAACGNDGVADLGDADNDGFEKALEALKNATPIAFSNDKVYKIQNFVSSNGYLISKEEEGQSRVFSSAKTSDLTTIENSDKWQLWTMQDGEIRMLYNQGTGKFIKYDQPNNQWILQDEMTIVNVGHNNGKVQGTYWIQDPDYTGQYQYMHVNNGQEDATGVKGWETSADASNFSFVEVDGAIAKDLSQYELSYLKAVAQEMVDSYDGDAYQTYVGAFKAEAINALKDVLAKEDATFEELKAAIGAAREGRTKPKAGQYYWMQSVMTFDDGHTKGIYENPDGNNIAWATPSEEAKELWLIEDAGDGKYSIKSVNTGKYIAQDGAKFKMRSGGTTAFTMVPKAKTYNFGLETFNGVNYTMSMNTTDSPYSYAPKSATEGGYVVSYNGYGQDIPTQWNIIEADHVNVAIGETGYATAYFPFAVTIPAGVTAYTVAAAADGVATLSKLSGTIPANTGVVLSGTANTPCTFEFAADAAAVDGNMLKGMTIATAVLAETKAYILANGSKGVGFYRLSESDRTIAANKAYLIVDDAAAPSAFSLKLDGGLTGIEGVENVAGKAPAYDLQGRRLPQVPTKGLYIQNGKKVIK